MLNGDEEAAIEAIIALAERVFAVPPFVPERIPADWRDVLRLWLQGLPVATATAGGDADAFQFIEGGIVYRLPWALEAIRVRGIANGDILDEHGTTLEDVELGVAVPALETGTLNRSAALLMQAGFTSRLAAIKVVQDGNGQFSSTIELGQWLFSEQVAALTDRGDWPTPETAEMWRAFRVSFSPVENSLWTTRRYDAPVTWEGEGTFPHAGASVRLYCHPQTGECLVLSDSGERLGRLNARLNPRRKGLSRVTALEDRRRVSISYVGPEDFWAQ
jgi:hypothetical protein